MICQTVFKKTKAKLLADDTNLSAKVLTIEDQWLTANKLTLNETKTEIMIV